ncbi:MAG TPA: DUF222 domain-containing protein [Candidatus Dormibacteraeota bacterium]
MYEGRGSQTAQQALELINAGVELLARQDLDPLDPALLGQDIELVQQTAHRLQLESTRRLRRFDADGGFRAVGASSAVDWMRDHGQMSAATAVKQVKLARQLDDLGSTVAAVQAGQVGFEHALEVASATAELGVEAEGELLQAAVTSAPEEVRQAARSIRHREDPAGMDALAGEQIRRRRLRLWETGNGMTALEGELPPVSGQRLRLCLESLIGIPAKADRRSQEQRQADALEELCRRQLAGGGLPNLGGRKPQLTLVVRAETLAGVEGSEPAQLEGTGALALTTVKELLGESAIRLAVEGKGGVTLNFGRARRTHSDLQRLESSRKHPSCGVERCTRRARQCQVHHLDPWNHDGETDVARSAPLCLKHHRLVSEGWRLLAGKSGRYALEPPAERGRSA